MTAKSKTHSSSEQTFKPEYRSLLKTLTQDLRFSRLQIEDHLPEQTVRPREPLSRPVRLVEGIDALVDKTWNEA